MTAEEWARCYRAFGRSVPADEERARTVFNPGLGPRGMDLMRRLDILGRLGRVECPVLVVVGRIDPITQVADASDIVAALPEGLAILEVIEDAGHFVWRDAPDVYWPTVIDFVTSVGPTA